jgi:hypothetical protein
MHTRVHTVNQTSTRPRCAREQHVRAHGRARCRPVRNIQMCHRRICRLDPVRVTGVPTAKYYPRRLRIHRQELADFGIRVVLLQPAFYCTQLCSVATAEAGLQRTWNRLTADKRDEYGEHYLPKCEGMCK